MECCQLMEEMFDAFHRIREEQNTPKAYPGGMLLYQAEVNLLEAIHRCPERSAAALAGLLHISKGALAQTVKKLVDKNLVTQYNPPGNRKTKHYALTDQGEAVRKSNEATHREANQRMRDYLCSRPLAEKKVLSNFMRAIGECGQICLFECHTGGCLAGSDLSPALEQQEEQ